MTFRADETTIPKSFKYGCAPWDTSPPACGSSSISSVISYTTVPGGLMGLSRQEPPRSRLNRRSAIELQVGVEDTPKLVALCSRSAKKLSRRYL